MKTIKVKLNPNSVEKAIKELQDYKAEIKRRVKLLIEMLVDRGADIARAKVIEYDAYNYGNLYNSISGVITEERGLIQVDSEYALFVEFGTGPIGSQNPHPGGENVTYKSEPWYTKADGKPMDLLYGWTPTELEDGTVIYKTYGQKSKPFMWNTAQELRANLLEFAKEVFND